MRILLVEDEESLRDTMAANLDLEGHIVLEAADGRQAIELLEKNHVDLVLSDIRMPNLGGIGLLQFVKKRHPHIPVVLMTAYTAQDQVETAIAEGVFTVLRKPFDLGAAVEALVRAARAPLVLVVDDDRSDAVTMAEHLRTSGVKAEAAFDAEQALSVVRSGVTDVCVVDLKVPTTNGQSLTEKLRQVDPGLSVILCSSHDAGDVLSRMSLAGIGASLTKPVDPKELLGIVAKVRGAPWS